jgi:ribose transport system substrate-binding protein
MDCVQMRGERSIMGSSSRKHRGTPRGLMRGLPVAALLAATVAVAACGSSAPEPDTGAAAQDGASASPVVQEAADAVKKASAPLTSWPGPTEPVKAVKGKKVGIITCGAFENCIRMGQGVVDAAEALGWSTMKFDPQLYTPGELNGAVERMLGSGADIIVDAGALPRATFAPSMAAARKKGALFMSLRAGDGGDENVEVGDPDERFMGQMAADWIIADSKGTGQVITITDNEYAAAQLVEKSFREALAKCTGCKAEGTADVISAKFATDTAPSTISLLRRFPKVKYVFASYDGQARLAAQAAKQIGRNDVKTLATGGEKATREQIMAGNGQDISISLAHEWSGWAVVDAALRILNKQPVIEKPGVPGQLTDKSNADHQFTGDVDYEAEYRKLWGLDG